MKINCSKDLYNLGYDDAVVFCIGGVELEYRVCSRHMSCITEDNDYIFELLGVQDKYSLASLCYGYTADDGVWPSAHVKDYSALERLCRVLYEMQDAHNAMIAKAKEEAREDHKEELQEEVHRMRLYLEENK